MTSMLSIRNLHVRYGNIDALRGIDIDINHGEIVSLIGANGAGKSTLMMSIFGDPKPAKGTIVYKNTVLTDLPTHKIAKLDIALSPEGRRIFPRMTVFENLQMGAISNSEGTFAEDEERTYEIFPILKTRRQQRAGTLSGGEQQMLSIARALMSKPELLLLDEPSLGLAPLVMKKIFAILKDLNRRQGVTVFLVEQNAYAALKLANRAYVLVNGKITLSGSGSQLLQHDDIKSAYLEGGN